MLFQVILIFSAGVLLDVLVTKYTRCVAAGQPKTAAALSGLITLANLIIWGTVIQHGQDLGLYGAFAAAGGSSVGTLLGFRRGPS